MKKLVYIILGTLTLASCEGLTEKNEITKSAADVPAITLLSNAQKEIADYNADPDINRLLPQQWAEVQYIDQSTYDLNQGNTAALWWNGYYRDILVDLDEFTRLVEEDDSYLSEEVRQNHLAVGEINKVYAWYILVTTFGNVPYSEALNFENAFPVYDDAETIYLDLLNRIDVAIAQIQVDAGFGNQASGDLIYGGNMDNWFAYANSLKLRMAMLIADQNPAIAGPAAAAAAPNAFTSNEQNATFQYMLTTPNTNPIFVALDQSGRNDYVAANTMVDLLNDIEDPRRQYYFTPFNGEYVGGVYGDFNVYANFSHVNPVIVEENFPHIIMDYSEVEFLRAEAVERGFISGSAATHYNNGIRASMEYWSNTFAGFGGEGLSEADINSYLANPDVVYQSDNWKEKIGLQKYIALYNRGYDAWTEWRKFDYPVLNPPPGTEYNSIPVRYTYPIAEQNVNESNFESAAEAVGGDELTTKLWWDVN